MSEWGLDQGLGIRIKDSGQGLAIAIRYASCHPRGRAERGWRCVVNYWALLVLLAVAVATMRHFVGPHLESLQDSPERGRAGAAARLCFETVYAFLLVALATYGAVGGWMLTRIQASSSSPADAYWLLVLPLVVVAAVLLTLLIGGVIRARAAARRVSDDRGRASPLAGAPRSVRPGRGRGGRLCLVVRPYGQAHRRAAGEA